MTTSAAGRLRLFEAYGIELEYAIVDRETLRVLPVADEVLRTVTGEYANDYEAGPVAWSNELVLHVIELKTNGPTPALGGWPARFGADVRRIDEILRPLNGRLMPTGMHPTMVPDDEIRLWPHDGRDVYDAYDRIFGCRGHGWANLHSCHLNLPFAGDDEFGRLHAAIRVVLPMLPALAASSPLVEGRVTGLLDNRLEAYRVNQARVPAITGAVVPEPVYTIEAYRREILDRLYADVRPLDPNGILQHEFLNSRGAIARFERDAIEIRLLDVQETPAADVAIVALVVATLRALVAERWMSMAELKLFAVDGLAALLLRTIREAEEALVDDPGLLRAFGWPGGRARVGEIWQHLAGQLLARGDIEADVAAVLEIVLRRGPLARRILRACGAAPGPERIHEVYARLCDCLRDGVPFEP